MVVVFLTQTIQISDVKYTPRSTQVKDIIIYHAQEQEVSSDFMLKLAFCESSFRYNAKGDFYKGKPSAYGIFQYHKQTFDRYSKMYGQKLDYYSSEDQAKLTAWIMKNHPEEMSAWACTDKIK